MASSVLRYGCALAARMVFQWVKTPHRTNTPQRDRLLSQRLSLHGLVGTRQPTTCEPTTIGKSIRKCARIRNPNPHFAYGETMKRSGKAMKTTPQWNLHPATTLLWLHSCDYTPGTTPPVTTPLWLHPWDYTPATLHPCWIFLADIVRPFGARFGAPSSFA